MTLRKYGTGPILGTESAEDDEVIQKTATDQAWDVEDEQALTDEREN